MKTKEDVPAGADLVKLARVLNYNNNTLRDEEKHALFDDNLEAIGQYTQGKIVRLGDTTAFVVGTQNGFLNFYGLDEKPTPNGM